MSSCLTKSFALRLDKNGWVSPRMAQKTMSRQELGKSTVVSSGEAPETWGSRSVTSLSRKYFLSPRAKEFSVFFNVFFPENRKDQ